MLSAPGDLTTKLSGRLTREEPPTLGEPSVAWPVRRNGLFGPVVAQLQHLPVDIAQHPSFRDAARLNAEDGDSCIAHPLTLSGRCRTTRRGGCP
jgi:hypothetical protein